MALFITTIKMRLLLVLLRVSGLHVLRTFLKVKKDPVHICTGYLMEATLS